MDRFREFYDAIRLPSTFHTHPQLVDQLFDYVDMTVGACSTHIVHDARAGTSHDARAHQGSTASGGCTR